MEQGFRNVSVEELCNATGVSRVTFYKYFPNMDSLVETVFDECWAEAFPAIDENFNSSKDIGQILDTYYNLSLDFVSSKVSVRMFADMEILMPWKYEELRKYEIDQLIKLVKRGQKEGLIGKDIDPKVVSFLLGEIMRNVIRPGFLISNDLTLKQVGSTIKEIFLHGLLGRNENNT